MCGVPQSRTSRTKRFVRLLRASSEPTARQIADHPELRCADLVAEAKWRTPSHAPELFRPRERLCEHSFPPNLQPTENQTAESNSLRANRVASSRPRHTPVANRDPQPAMWLR